jgi:nitrate reductase delta subunit
MERIARLFEYPGEGYRSAAREAALASGSAEIAEFAGRIASFSTEELQELFIQTFDLNPDCTLDIGWHLFGENYERGEFLVKLRLLIRRHGIEESAELPDHLTHVLKLLDRMDQQEGGELSARCVLPALEKMLHAIEGKGSPFEELLRGLRKLIQVRVFAIEGGVRA